MANLDLSGLLPQMDINGNTEKITAAISNETDAIKEGFSEVKKEALKVELESMSKDLQKVFNQVSEIVPNLQKVNETIESTKPEALYDLAMKRKSATSVRQPSELSGKLPMAFAAPAIFLGNSLLNLLGEKSIMVNELRNIQTALNGVKSAAKGRKGEKAESGGGGGAKVASLLIVGSTVKNANKEIKDWNALVKMVKNTPAVSVKNYQNFTKDITEITNGLSKLQDDKNFKKSCEKAKEAIKNLNKIFDKRTLNSLKGKDKDMKSVAKFVESTAVVFKSLASITKNMLLAYIGSLVLAKPKFVKDMRDAIGNTKNIIYDEKGKVIVTQSDAKKAKDVEKAMSSIRSAVTDIGKTAKSIILGYVFMKVATPLMSGVTKFVKKANKLIADVKDGIDADAAKEASKAMNAVKDFAKDCMKAAGYFILAGLVALPGALGIVISVVFLSAVKKLVKQVQEDIKENDTKKARQKMADVRNMALSLLVAALAFTPMIILGLTGAAGVIVTMLFLKAFGKLGKPAEEAAKAAPKVLLASALFTAAIAVFAIGIFAACFISEKTTEALVGLGLFTLFIIGVAALGQISTEVIPYILMFALAAVLIGVAFLLFSVALKVLVDAVNNIEPATIVKVFGAVVLISAVGLLAGQASIVVPFLPLLILFGILAKPALESVSKVAKYMSDLNTSMEDFDFSNVEKLGDAISSICGAAVALMWHSGELKMVEHTIPPAIAAAKKMQDLVSPLYDLNEKARQLADTSQINNLGKAFNAMTAAFEELDLAKAVGMRVKAALAAGAIESVAEGFSSAIAKLNKLDTSTITNIGALINKNISDPINEIHTEKISGLVSSIHDLNSELKKLSKDNGKTLANLSKIGGGGLYAPKAAQQSPSTVPAGSETRPGQASAEEILSEIKQQLAEYFKFQKDALKTSWMANAKN